MSKKNLGKVQVMSHFKYLVGSAQFAALEPSWAGIHNEQQLRGLLILGALFNKILYIHDTQIADNPHLLRSYRLRPEKPNNLFNLVTKLVENKVIRVGLRDATYIASRDQNIACDSLFDVYSSWLSQDMERAWVIPPHTEDRIEFLKDFDEVLDHVDILRYPYTTIKKEFMRRTREELNYSKNPIHYREFKKLPANVRKRYIHIINRNWFSHSDIFELLRKTGLTISHPFIQTHGLFDESSYTHWYQSRLLGCDSSLWNGEDFVAGFEETSQITPIGSLSHASLQRHAVRTIKAPGLSLIATLNPHEILQLRERASRLFQIVEFMDECRSLDTMLELRDNYLEEVTTYWHDICSYLRKTRPLLTQRRTKIGIFTRDKLPGFSLWGRKFVSFAINLGLDFLHIPILKEMDKNDREKLLNDLLIRFIFFTDTSTMSQLESMFPRKSWLSRYHRDVLGD